MTGSGQDEDRAYERDRPLIAVPPEDAPWWPDGSAFALTFNAYDRLGSFDSVAKLANDTAAGFAANGALPPDIDELRACLFFEQRRYRHFDSDPYERSKSREYLKALIRRIRELSGGTLQGPPDPMP